MRLNFRKYQGTGNDFIMIDDRLGDFPVSSDLIQTLCDRRFGIGSDGLILIRNHPTLDYQMIYFNADGSQSLCGNGCRCGFAFAQEIGIVHEAATFEASDGVHKIKKEGDLIHFQLFDTPLPQQINDKEWFINTGSPHHIVLSDNVAEEAIVTKGRQIRYSEKYSSQNGTNVNFAQLLQNDVKVRTYERGVEDETLSCGTGATAVALMAGILGMKSPVQIHMKGGTLTVSFNTDGDNYYDIWLAGPAEKVFEGTVLI